MTKAMHFGADLYNEDEVFGERAIDVSFQRWLTRNNLRCFCEELKEWRRCSKVIPPNLPTGCSL